MRAIRCHRFAALEQQPPPQGGGNNNNNNENAKRPKVLKTPLPLSDVLSLDRVPFPASSSSTSSTMLGSDEVMVRTYYAGIQYPDMLQSLGLYQIRPSLPYVAGMDLAGVVVKVGSNVNETNFRVGDRVMAVCMENTSTSGAMAEYVVLPMEQIHRLPSNLPLATCANIGRNYFAAYHTLKTIGNITTAAKKESSLILVNGASGGVGMASIELAKAMGAKVIAGVSTPEKMDLPKTVDANVVLSYGTTKRSRLEFKSRVRKACVELGHPDGVDLVIDVVQGSLFETLISVVRPLGTVALVGFAGGQVPIRPGLLLVKEVNVVGSLWGRYANEFPFRHAENVKEILEHLSSGRIRPRVNRIYDLHEYVQAFEIFRNNRGRGNTVIRFLREDGEENIPVNHSDDRNTSKL